MATTAIVLVILIGAFVVALVALVNKNTGVTSIRVDFKNGKFEIERKN